MNLTQDKESDWKLSGTETEREIKIVQIGRLIRAIRALDKLGADIEGVRNEQEK
jgi:hypothetical protein